jgi:hypothetical protein
MWSWMGRRPVRRAATRWLANPWVLSAVGLAAASVVGMRLFRRA